MIYLLINTGMLLKDEHEADNKKRQLEAMKMLIQESVRASQGGCLKLSRHDPVHIGGVRYELTYSVYLVPQSNNKYRCYVADYTSAKGSFCKVQDIVNIFEIDPTTDDMHISRVDPKRKLVIKIPYHNTYKQWPLRGDDFDATYFAKIENAAEFQQNELYALQQLGEPDVQEVTVPAVKRGRDGNNHDATKRRIIEPKIGDYDLSGKSFEQFTNEQLESIALTLCQSVKRYHDANIVHRDIKPANIRVTNGSKPVAGLVDPGLACQVGAVKILAGTPAYLPKESWDIPPGEPLDLMRTITFAMDIYALSVTLFRVMFAKDEKSFHSKCLAHHSEARESEPIGRGMIAARIERTIKAIALPPDHEWAELYTLLVRGLDETPQNRPTIVEFVLACQRLPTNKPVAGPSRERMITP